MREANGIEARCQLGICLDLLGKDINGLVHVEQEAIDGVGDHIGAGGNAHRIGANVLARMPTSAVMLFMPELKHESPIP